MTAYFVTRHPGARDWAAAQGIEAKVVAHLDPDHIVESDLVMGTLPVSIVAEVCARGARYLHLELETPPGRRGQELSAADMEAHGARLQEYRAERIGDA